MKTDINGTSQCKKGEESFEVFYSNALKKEMVQYDFRTLDGELFSVVKSTLEKCRACRDEWLLKKDK